MANFTSLTIGTAKKSDTIADDGTVDIATSLAVPTISGVTTSTANTVNVGKSGTAGTLNVYPATASKGHVAFTASNASGDTTTTINVAAQAGAITYTIPDVTTAASFVMTQGAQTLTGEKTFATQATIGAGAKLKGDVGTGTCSSNAVTISKMAGIVTTESLNTAGGASQALVITNTTVAAGDVILISKQGGTNTTQNYALVAVATTNTITVTVYNNTAATALNGTLIFSFMVLKAA